MRHGQLHTCAVALVAGIALAGCATSPSPPGSSKGTAPAAPQRWHAPLPHGGELADLSNWWQQFDDPLLARLIDAGQRVGATLAQARARIADARAAHTAGAAALLPTLDLAANVGRGVQGPGAPAATSAPMGLQASWELDLFGTNRAAAQAARSRLVASQAGWHEARVSLAAEVASAYVTLRSCESLALQSELDAHSRETTARLTQQAGLVGLQPPAAVELAEASAAQGRLALTLQRAQCDQTIKTLVALTAIDETQLRALLADRRGQLPLPAALKVATVPGAVLAQRPDIAAAEQELAAAGADVAQAQGQRWTRVSLVGSVGAARSSSGGTSGGTSGGLSAEGAVWSVGPLTVTLPIFDAGLRSARAQAAEVRLAAAQSAYAAALRHAVREVETALVALHSASSRAADADRASLGYERAFLATAARHRAGLSSLVELEDARRSALTARATAIEGRRDGVNAWIALYRAIGGGWSAGANLQEAE